jgi:diaminopimelate decarboxylase
VSHSSALLPLFPDTAEIRDGVLWIGGHSAVELAEEYGTPLVVYCEETIRNAARAWRRGAGDGTVVYGTKAFPNAPLMKILWEEGIGADVSTLGEMKVAKAAGIPASSWVVHGNNKSDEELAFAAEKNAWLVVMDSAEEVERCVAAGVKRVLLRLTPGIEAGGHEKIMTGHLGSKFGVSPEDAVDVIRRAQDAGLELLGLHVHLGSQVMDDAPARTLVDWPAGWCSELRAELDWRPDILNLGGGLGIRYTVDDQVPSTPEQYGRTLTERVEQAWSANGLPRPRLVFEPGRSLVGRSGMTLYRVGAIKASGSINWVAVDGGMSDNPRPALYGARYSALLANRADETPSRAFAIAGKHCESGDVLIERVELPEPVRGDLLAIPATGAYSLSMASNYNAVPLPAAVLAERTAGPIRLRPGPSPANSGDRPEDVLC